MKIGLFIPCYVDAVYPEVGMATYKLLKQEQHLGRVKGPETKQRGTLVIKDKKYYLLYRGNYTELCDVNPISSMYISTWAGWAIDDKVNAYRLRRVLQGDVNDK